MILPSDKLGLIRDLITKLYARPFNEALVLDAAQSVTRLIDAHYFGFLIYAQHPPLLITNNPPEFTPIYLSVMGEDFLLNSLVATHEECILHRIRQRVQDEPEKQNFIETVQNARPISDTAYLPITLDGMIVGQWSLGRAGLKSPIYMDEQLEVFRFIGAFLNDAFVRSLIPPPPEEETAYLDYAGHIVSMGAKIQDAFDTLFGRGLILAAKPSHDDLRKIFMHGYKRFLHGSFKVGMDRLKLCSEDKMFSFLFKLLKPEGLSVNLDGYSYASVRLLDDRIEKLSAQVVDFPALSRIFSFTTRENQVTLGIFKGHTNKEIANTLGIDEGTIKYHTYNIYEKTGVHSRTELVLRLSGQKTN